MLSDWRESLGKSSVLGKYFVQFCCVAFSFYTLLEIAWFLNRLLWIVVTTFQICRIESVSSVGFPRHHCGRVYCTLATVLTLSEEIDKIRSVSKSESAEIVWKKSLIYVPECKVLFIFPDRMNTIYNFYDHMTVLCWLGIIVRHFNCNITMLSGYIHDYLDCLFENNIIYFH